MEVLQIIGHIGFFLVMAGGILVIPFGLPGGWIILADAFVYALATGFQKITWPILGILLAMALVAEGVELLSGIWGAKRYGASRRAIAGAIAGAILGAILMSPLLFLVGAMIGAFLGAFAGAFLIEFLGDRNLRRALRSGFGAFLGRMGAILAKTGMATAMAAIIISRFL